MSSDHGPIEDPDPARRLALLRGMVAHPDRRFRMLAMRKLLDAPPPDFEATLLELSRDPYHGVRSVVAWALGRMRAAQASPRLIAMLSDADPWVRKNAAVALAKLGAREAIPQLARLRRDPDRLVRGVAGWATRVIASGAKADPEGPGE